MALSSCAVALSEGLVVVTFRDNSEPPTNLQKKGPEAAWFQIFITRSHEGGNLVNDP